MPTPVGKGSIWEDGLGHGDKDARVVRRARTSHTPDPQSVRYGQGECEVIIEGVIAGPAFRDRPKVDVYWHEGLRPSFARLTPDGTGDRADADRGRVGRRSGGRRQLVGLAVEPHPTARLAGHHVAVPALRVTGPQHERGPSDVAPDCPLTALAAQRVGAIGPQAYDAIGSDQLAGRKAPLPGGLQTTVAVAFHERRLAQSAQLLDAGGLSPPSSGLSMLGHLARIARHTPGVGPHRHHHADISRSVTCAVITASDTRTAENDASGAAIRDALDAEGHLVLTSVICPDEPSAITHAIEEAIDTGARAILINGGTGIAPRDRTFDVVERLIQTPLPGFGELFRALSYEEVGSAAMLSRAAAGIYRDRLVVSMPGSTAAVRLAMTRLVLPELAHIVSELDS